MHILLFDLLLNFGTRQFVQNQLFKDSNCIPLALNTRKICVYLIGNLGSSSVTEN